MSLCTNTLPDLNELVAMTPPVVPEEPCRVTLYGGSVTTQSMLASSKDFMPCKQSMLYI